jgi:hypothetical protein
MNFPTKPGIRTGLIRAHSLITKMPSQPTVTKIRLGNILVCLNAAVTTMEVLYRGLNTPFLGPIVTTMWSLLAVVQVALRHPGLTGTDQIE